MLLMACTGQAEPVASASNDGLRAFESEKELTDFLKKQRQKAKDQWGEYDGGEPELAMAEAVPEPATPAPEEDSITNNQTAGVDEGGIVKRKGDIMVVLRRGRVFTISTANGDMRAIDHIDAFPPDANGRGSWYDEMLISGNRVIVIGYSYARGGTEITRFTLSDEGKLSYEDAYHLRSNDYYSAENYASRLIGTELIFYSPLNLYYGEQPLDALPGVRRWNGDNGERAFSRIAGPKQVFIAGDLFDDPDDNVSTLHSVTRCDVASDDFDCDATAVIAGWSREFYVSGDAVYLWMVDNSRREQKSGDKAKTNAHLYRLPLDGSRPQAIRAMGMPINQFSFLEEPDKQRINVLVTGESTDPAIEISRGSGGIVSLIQLPLDALGDGSDSIAADHYRALSDAEGSYWEMENRFVGNHIVYGHGRQRGYGSETKPTAYAASLSGGDAVPIPVKHGVERIEKLGSDAVIIGSGEENTLGFSAVTLHGEMPRITNVFTMPAAGQGESRSHAYFFRPDRGSRDGASGTLGLPIARQVERRFQQQLGSSAAMLFLRRDNRQFSLAGELNADPGKWVDDGCQASCVDWYGNARPIFMGDRIFALMGYELVEGELKGGRIRETGRLNYTPQRYGRKERTLDGPEVSPYPVD
ncbi:beta-propeller domain-containing protein [Alterisphingorhabdus coralli]|uniref:Beta-propeller domain-containing protein n=1 Tax=Alterisphingorhabdus coralli TaxID=3071408 RepID=A0AA97F918_9SPHN|nr:beta-propeller domain-containing protein [Parasphingorhabdus sp. SCSIO 66989]WOE76198.1 beta-propeller domain-containing protein [Parasphingorhabdus sp. SCSIO 66989]